MTVAMLVALAGCVTVEATPSPIQGSNSSGTATALATRTLNPNELAQRGITHPPLPSPTPSTVTPTTTPAPTPVVRPSQAPVVPDLEALLPRAVDGHAATIQSARIAADRDWRGGDMCSFFCPGELGDTARALGEADGMVDLAIATVALGSQQAVIVCAIRLPRHPGTEILETWISTQPRTSDVVEIRPGGKSVTLVVDGYLPDAASTRYLYPHGDVLFMVLAFPVADDITKPASIVKDLLAGLP